MITKHFPVPQRKHLNLFESWRFLQCAKQIKERDKRVFCLILFYTGCRISEALELTPAQIDEGEGSIFFRTLKQRQVERFRQMHIYPSVMKELMKHIRQNNISEQDYIWNFRRTTAWGLVKDCMDRAKIKGIKAVPKGLRHAFAVSCIDCNVPVFTLQTWMGHSKIETTSIYVQLSTKEERRLIRRVWRSYNGISHVIFWLKNLWQ